MLQPKLPGMESNASVNQTAEDEAMDKASADEYFLGKYCRHIPRILRRQLIAKLVNQYVNRVDYPEQSANVVDESLQSRTSATSESNTSIFRFHGSLLFVDISGFTVLSQKMKVDDLKNQINAYFQKIVNIIDKYDGEIIKFAGDALFIIWQTKVNSTEDPGFFQATKVAAQCAVKCGIEINVECGNYAINLGKNKSQKISKFSSKLGHDKGKTLYSDSGNAELAQGILDLARRSLSEEQKVDAAMHPASGGLHLPTEGKISPTQATFQRKMKAKRKKAKAQVTYLNIHAGVSVGVMAGMDVGAHDRFEYLLLGQPMSEVAVAESEAGKGEIVVSPSVHDLIHSMSPRNARQQERSKHSPRSPRHALSCGCVQTPSGYFCVAVCSEEAVCEVNFGATASSIPASVVSSMEAAETQEENREVQYDFELYSHIVEELLTGYKSIAGVTQKQFSATLKAFEQSQRTNESVASVVRKPNAIVAMHTQNEVLTEHFFSWAQHCLLDDIAKHVHEVVRKGFTFHNEIRISPYGRFVESSAAVEAYYHELERVLRDKSESAGHSFVATQPASSLRRSITRCESNERMGRSMRSRKDKRDSFVNKIRQLNKLTSLRERKHEEHQKVLNKDGALVSELRNVIVLFISVKMENSALYLDSESSRHQEEMKVQTCKVKSFYFLSRTTEEMEADKKLINQFQSCMEVLTEVFQSKGGQLRQFIVDDKGTVCIGTFGLRGSVNYDNAASAIDAADSIVSRLQALGFNASVGVTSGAAYCGLVGSNTRHEYAVMGPSTNLSARLMGRAAEGEIICDSAIRLKDRLHMFASLGAVAAKGYTSMVPIFKPQFDVEVKRTSMKIIRSQSFMARAVSSKNKAITMDVVDARTEVFGRKNDVLNLFKFFAADAAIGDLEQLCLTFWKTGVHEDPTKLDDLSHVLAPFPFLADCTDDRRRSSHMKQDAQRCRFDITRPTKFAMIVAPNGMGKTLVLDLFHTKISQFVQKDRKFYNIALFRHQAGYMNSSTLFSAWYSQVKQTLYSIAEYLAEAGDASSTRYLHALNDGDFDPIVEFLQDYLPVELRPYTALLAMVGIKLSGDKKVFPISPVAEGDNEDLVADSLESASNRGGALFGLDIADNGDSSNPIDALDSVEKLNYCAELVVAIARLHVQITRKMTIYIMDDLQYYDPLSQDLQRLMYKNTLGILLLCTYRASTLESAPAFRNSQTFVAPLEEGAMVVAPTESVIINQPEMIRRETHSVNPLNAALFNSPNSDTFHRLYLEPLTQDACQRLFTKVFGGYGITVAEDDVFSKLHTLCAGSPLYAVELAKSICERYIHRECNSNEPQSTLLCNRSLFAIIDDLRADRIEEMVHFRFDKLTEQCQLVLKMAAIAGITGSHFTFALLGWLLDNVEASDSDKFEGRIMHTSDSAASLNSMADSIDNDGSLAGSVEGQLDSTKGGWNRFTMNLSQALNDLLEAGEFIEYRAGSFDDFMHTEMVSSWLNANNSSSSSKSVKNSPKHAKSNNEVKDREGNVKIELDGWGFDRSTLHNLKFFWKVDMELRAIYDLMLDEQKESLHERVAMYMENEFSDGRTISASEWYQLACHWERATSWSSAMTCYFNSGMLLSEQGDLLGSKAQFSSAFQMLTNMRHEAGQKTNVVQLGPVPVLGNKDRPKDAGKNYPNQELLGLLHALGGRRSGLTVQDLYKLYEGDAQLLHVGFSLITRIAQGLIGHEHSSLSIKLFEEAIEMMQVLLAGAQPMRAVDGFPFILRNISICFAVLSGMFLLLITGQAQDDALHSRVQATVAASEMLARSDPASKVHLIMALANKLKMLDLFQAANPAVTPGIISTATDLMGLYDPEVHSADLVYFYNSDRAGNAFCVVLKTMCMKGHFRDNVKFLDHAKQLVSKTKHFYSLSLGILVLFPILLMYHSDSQAQILYQKYRRVEAKQQKNDFRDGVAIWMEWCSQVRRFEHMKQKFDESIYADECMIVERIIQSRVFAQDQQSHFYLNLVRLHCIGVEYAVANICYLKALKYELYALHYKTPETYRETIKNYLQLGLTHLTFTPAQAAMNQMFLFSNLHEKLLRAQLLMKSVTYSDNITEARGLWAAALENLMYCVAVGQRNDFQAVLLQTGVLLQALANLPFPDFLSERAVELSIPEADVLETNECSSTLALPTDFPEINNGQNFTEKDANSNAAAALHPSANTHVLGSLSESLTETEMTQRAELKAQGADIQANALQYMKQMNGEEVVEELLKHNLCVQLPNKIDIAIL